MLNYRTNDNGDSMELIIRAERKEDYSRITEVTDLAFKQKNVKEAEDSTGWKLVKYIK